MSSEVIAQSLFSWLDDAGNTNTLDVDVVMATTDKRTAKLTDHVVEDGSVITDHVVIMPESLTLELVVSQTPIKAEGFAPAPVNLNASAQKLDIKQYPIDVRPSQFQPGGFLFLSSGLRSLVSNVPLLGALLGGGSKSVSSMQGSAANVAASSFSVQTLQATTPADRVIAVHDQLIDILDNVLLVTVSFKGRLFVDYLLTEVELQQTAGKAGIGKFRVEARAFRTVTGTTVQLPDPADFRALPNTNKGNKAGTTPDPDPSKGMKSIAAHTADGDVSKAVAHAVEKLLPAL